MIFRLPHLDRYGLVHVCGALRNVFNRAAGIERDHNRPGKALNFIALKRFVHRGVGLLLLGICVGPHFAHWARSL